MKTLHTLNKSPTRQNLYRDLKSAVSNKDSLILIEDGVYFCQRIELLDALQVDSIYVLLDDLTARGVQLPTSELVAVQKASYEDFVELSCTHDKVISWY